MNKFINGHAQSCYIFIFFYVHYKQLKTPKIAYLSKLIAVKVDTEHIADTFCT